MIGGCAASRTAPARSQFGELTLPAATAVRGVVVVVHGGFWRHAYGLELGRPLAADLAAAGFAAWNIEYRRVGGGGGWPATFDDVAAALDALAGPVQRRRRGRCRSTGSSPSGTPPAGTSRPGSPPGPACRPARPGAAPRVRLRGAVSQAGVLDLVDASEQRLGRGAVARPARRPARRLSPTATRSPPRSPGSRSACR